MQRTAALTLNQSLTKTGNCLLSFSGFNANGRLQNALRVPSPKLQGRNVGFPACGPELWSRRFLGGAGVGFLTTLGVGVGFFCPSPTPDVQLDHFLHHTPN